MTATKFFRNCRELVLIRWVLLTKEHGDIYLLQVSDYFNEEYKRALMPMVAVAVDIFGAGVKDRVDDHQAAKLLGLSLQVATLVHAASYSSAPPNKLIAEVRSELLHSLNSSNRLLVHLREEEE